jgi:hypothetical protein
MSKKQYLVHLNEQERHRLQQIVRSGKHKARKIARCRVLLLADGPTGKTDQEISVPVSLRNSRGEPQPRSRR